MNASLLALAPVVVALVVYLGTQVIFAAELVRARRARASRVDAGRGASAAPRVSILKPLAGADDDLEANLASFAAIDYPDFELLFGVANALDPALPVVRRFLARHPHVRARLVMTDPDAAINPKVAQLLRLLAESTGEVLVISDSNVRVGEGYLRTLVRELGGEGVGLVTSIFSGTGEQTLGAALENLQLGAIVAPGIIAYNRLSSSPLTLGKSMAMRRRDLDALGGLAQVGGVLAEDYALGRLFLAAGLEVKTSLDLVQNRNVEAGFSRTLERHTRWAKMRRAIVPAAFLVEPMQSPLAMATLMLPLSPTRVQIAAVLATALIQTVVGFASMRALRGSTLAWYYAPLEVVRTYVALACWAFALVSRRVVWRGHAFMVGSGSALTPVDVAPSSHAPESL